jgi:hypothetical protein
MEILSAIENSRFPTWVRTTPSIWGYSMFLFLHTVGLATVVGISTVVALRLLGFAPRMPLAPLARFFPVIWIGFWINAVSGTILLAQDATTTLTNPAFFIKMILVALAAADMLLVRRLAFRETDPGHGVSGSGRLLAAASLLLWFGATAAGRLMPYFGSVSGAPGLRSRIGG